MNIAGWTDDAVLIEIGERIQTERLNRNLTIQEVSDRAGVSVGTISKVERGHNHSLKTLLGILRALGLLSRVEALLPGDGPSPIQLAMLRGKRRQRATGSRGESSALTSQLPW